MHNSGVLRREIIDHCAINTLLPERWLPLRHDCCGRATLRQDLVVNPAGRCERRFFATPLHEIIPP
jgi:hypothetical protein